MRTLNSNGSIETTSNEQPRRVENTTSLPERLKIRYCGDAACHMMKQSEQDWVGRNSCVLRERPETYIAALSFSVESDQERINACAFVDHPLTSSPAWLLR